MKHILENGSILYNGKCEDFMEDLIKEDKKVDIILTSPPYNTGKRTGSSDAYARRYDSYKDNMNSKEYIYWSIYLFNQFNRILSENGVVLYNLSYGTDSIESANVMWEVIYKIINETPFVLTDVISWKKSNALPNNTSPNKLTRITEFVFVFVRESEFKTFNANKKVKSISKTGQKYYENTYNFIEAKNNDGSNRLNKATFSTDLVIQLLNIYASKDSVVYDPFNGTGTTSNACIKFGCPFYGSEISKEQHEYAINRIESK